LTRRDAAHERLETPQKPGKLSGKSGGGIIIEWEGLVQILGAEKNTKRKYSQQTVGNSEAHQHRKKVQRCPKNISDTGYRAGHEIPWEKK